MTLTIPSQARKPFSEIQQIWFTEIDLPPLTEVNDVDAFLAGLISGNYQPQKHLKVISKNGAHSKITLYFLENEDAYITLVSRKLQYPRNYKSLTKFDDKTIVEYMRVSNGIGQAFKSFGTEK